ncbi:3'-5' exonuclease [Streptomyces aculeolatus]|uniref:exonuclease domain-containing protein n=1 Tax=Streptomyces aculeolatus TaxID=270689 RepID=UPI001CED4CAD|nr:exonuclease domain-containing protein [Streptomyces aculeolatus]
MSWHTGPMTGFDLESTGVDPETDRIVTACVVTCGLAPGTDSRTWLADPDVDIPAESTAVHGITTEKVRTEGRPAAEVVAELVQALAEAVEVGQPIVIMNAAFDLTMLDREARRHGVKPLTDVVGDRLNVIDPRVLDKHVDQYRRGGRTLTDLCAHYRVRLDDAHSADADALAACRVAWRIARGYTEIGTAALATLHLAQVRWAREQAEGLRDYFARTPGKESWAAGVRTDWPLIPFEAVGADA